MGQNRDNRVRPTAEAIEAALSAWQPIEDAKTGELTDDTRTFFEIVFNHERLRLQIIDLASAFGAPVGEYTSPSDWQRLAQSGHVNADLMMKITMLADMFFWIGWHSRGAIEEADTLRGIAGE